MPTGVHLRDVRDQLFNAAERILLAHGPAALTSRAVTEEAGVAKGVLHRHFDDFDAFLAEFVEDRAHHLDAHVIAEPGTGTVADNLADALTRIFTSAAVAVVPLITFRDELRARLRNTWPAGVPVLTEAVTVIEAYLAAERDRGRIPASAPIEVLAPTLIGSAHLLFADRDTPPDQGDLRTMVATVIGSTAGH